MKTTDERFLTRSSYIAHDYGQSISMALNKSGYCGIHSIWKYTVDIWYVCCLISVSEDYNSSTLSTPVTLWTTFMVRVVVLFTLDSYSETDNLFGLNWPYVFKTWTQWQNRIVQHYYFKDWRSCVLFGINKCTYSIYLIYLFFWKKSV